MDKSVLKSRISNGRCFRQRSVDENKWQQILDDCWPWQMCCLLRAFEFCYSWSTGHSINSWWWWWWWWWSQHE